MPAGSGFAGSGVGVGAGALALLEVMRLKSSVILVMGEAMIGCFLAPSAGLMPGRTEHEIPATPQG